MYVTEERFGHRFLYKCRAPCSLGESAVSHFFHRLPHPCGRAKTARARQIDVDGATLWGTVMLIAPQAHRFLPILAETSPSLA